MMVLTDPEEFSTNPEVDVENSLPVPPRKLLINIQTGKQIILELLEDVIPRMCDQKGFSTGFSYIKASLLIASEILKCSTGGGQIFLFQASDSLALEFPFSTQKGKPTKSPLIPTSNEMMDFCRGCSYNGISINIFVSGERFKNVVTLAEYSRHTNGCIFYYRKSDLRQFQNDLFQTLTELKTHDSVLRVRISKGWKVSSIYGNYLVKSTDLLSIPHLDDSKTLLYKFELEEQKYSSPCFYIQSALLYTTEEGQRRIRVQNYCAPVTNSLKEIYANANAAVIANYYLRASLARLYIEPTNLLQTRNLIIFCSKKLLRKWIDTCGEAGKPFQEVHRRLRPLLKYTLGFLKHQIYQDSRGKVYAETDLYNVLRVQLNQMRPKEALKTFVPFLFEVNTMHQIHNYGGCFDTKNPQKFIFPKLQPLTYTSLDPNGVYLMETGQRLILFICQEVFDTVLQELFKVEIRSFKDLLSLQKKGQLRNFSHLRSFDLKSNHEKLGIPQMDSDARLQMTSYRLALLVEQLLKRRSFRRFQSLEIGLQGSETELERTFHAKLIEDRASSTVFGSLNRPKDVSLEQYRFEVLYKK